MSEKEIKKGDKVRIWWADQTCLKGTLQYMPQATGDLMQVIDEQGDVRYINTGCSTFEQMTSYE